MSTHKPWLKSYPKEVLHEIDMTRYKSLADYFEKCVEKFLDKPAFVNMGASMSFAELDRASRNFAAYLQKVAGLKKGDRIALQMPNMLQYPVALIGALRAGLVVVNTNPLYTPREMEHQFKDSGIRAIVIMANFAHNLEEIISRTQIDRVIVTELGDLLGFPKKHIVNFVVKKVKKLVKDFKFSSAVTFSEALALGAQHNFTAPTLGQEDLAFLQYTGGTTGVSKGAMLSHGNMLANILQCSAWMGTYFEDGKEIVITALPLYHIFSLTVNGFLLMGVGAQNILITNPKDIPAFIKEIAQYPFTIITGVNTLFNALMNHKDFSKVNFSRLKVSVGGGMAVQKAVAERWKKATGIPLAEGYGLTETAPVLCCNPLNGTERTGFIGLPLPQVDMSIQSDDGKILPTGEVGELCAKGPNVMRGYWQQEEESARALQGGWFHTGDLGFIDPDGFLKIVDRKKDMILVSGFNVYPNEVEDVMAAHPGVLEVAAIGIPDEKSGEVVKLFVVKRDPAITAEELLKYAREKLTAYKAPRSVEFRDELPKTNVGKILRRMLKDSK